MGFSKSMNVIYSAKGLFAYDLSRKLNVEMMVVRMHWMEPKSVHIG